MHVKKFLLLSVCMSFGGSHAMWRARVTRIMAGVTAARMVDSVDRSSQRSYAAPVRWRFAELRGDSVDLECQNGGEWQLLKSRESRQSELLGKECTYQGSVVDACWEVLWACGKQEISVEDGKLFGQEALELLQCALAKGQDVRVVDKQGNSGLHVLGIALATCPASGVVSRALHMLLGVQADATSVRFDDGSTLLHKAAKGGNAAVMHALVQVGLNVNARDVLGRTPLHVAASRSESLARSHNVDVRQCMERLCELGADVDAEDYEGLTPMHFADMNVVRRMLAEKTGMKGVNDSGNTPLIQAVLDGDCKRVQDLLDCGADLAARNNAGRTALQEAHAKVDASPDDVNARHVARLLTWSGIEQACEMGDEQLSE